MMPPSVLRGIGAVSRKFRPRGRERLAERLCQRHEPTSLPYTDITGLRRNADISDVIDGRWFMGVNVGLPGWVLSQVHSGQTALDVGANVGIVTGQLCQRVGRTGRVVAVEPLPANISRLEELAFLNDLPQLIVCPVAMSSTSDVARLRINTSDHSSPWASFTASWIDGGVIDVATRTLDDLAADLGSPISFIKIDVEGAEELVVRGGKKVLSEDRPLVYSEFNDIVLRDAGSSSADLLRTFAEFGYEPCGGDNPADLDGKVANVLLRHRGTADFPARAHD